MGSVRLALTYGIAAKPEPLRACLPVNEGPWTPDALHDLDNRATLSQGLQQTLSIILAVSDCQAAENFT